MISETDRLWGPGESRLSLALLQHVEGGGGGEGLHYTAHGKTQVQVSSVGSSQSAWDTGCI